MNMQAIIGEYRDGQVFLAGKADWPEHTKVRVEPVEETTGIRDEDWPTDPAGIARLLQLIDSLEPLEMTPQEEAEWKAAVRAQNEYTLSKLDERIRRVERESE
jgi:hypothetical protein